MCKKVGTHMRTCIFSGPALGGSTACRLRTKKNMRRHSWGIELSQHSQQSFI